MGDAAGLVDPFTGEGIRHAIKSGYLAATAIRNTQVYHFQNWIDRQIGESQTIALSVEKFFYAQQIISYEFGVRNPPTTKAFMDLLSDRIGYGQVVLRVFGSIPYSFFIMGVQMLSNHSSDKRAENTTIA